MNLDYLFDYEYVKDKVQSRLASEEVNRHLAKDDGDPFPMYVISNESAYNGSAAILNKGVQAKLDEIFENGCHIVPSSIHEIIAVPADCDTADLLDMVRTVNQSDDIDDCDILSNHVYKYCKGVLTLAM